MWALCPPGKNSKEPVNYNTYITSYIDRNKTINLNVKRGGLFIHTQYITFSIILLFVCRCTWSQEAVDLTELTFLPQRSFLPVPHNGPSQGPCPPLEMA